MKYLVKCLVCGATAWLRGNDDPDTNGLELIDGRDTKWEPHSECQHQEYEVIDVEYIEPLDLL